MKKIHIAGLVLIAISIGFIISLTGDYSQYQTFKKAATENGKTFTVIGNVNKDKELIYDPIKDPNLFSFYLKDSEGTDCKVVFTGTKPQDFERSESIVLTGKMVGNEFHADKILMKCPSKYKNNELVTSEYKSKS